MGRSKIIINQETYIDLTADTVNANNTLVGASGHGADGEPFNGAVACNVLHGFFCSVSKPWQ